MRKWLSMALAAALAVTMTVPAMALNPVAPETPPSDTPEPGFFVTVEAIEPEELGSGEVKWMSEETPDGWIKVTNEGGVTLGYSPESGVELLQVDGFAFKDLDKDGMLDGYEDWRNDAETRAKDLASQLSGPEMAPMTTHGGWGAFGEEYPQDDPYVNGGGRGGVTRANHAPGNTENAVKWTNSLQGLCEKLPWGVPALISVDPAETSSMINNLSMAATMNPELAQELGEKFSKQWRAVGISVFLGPQVDLMSPVMDRASGTMGEDPALTRDLTQAFVNGLQSTYDEEGNDLGFGKDSVYCMTKHFGGAGASEGGRNDHRNPGRYSVFPGGNFEAHFIAYFDGAFNLPGETKSAGLMMQYAIDIVDGEPYGGEWGGAYNPYLTRLVQENWDGFAITDWGIVSGPMADWGVDEFSYPERLARILELGTDNIGLQSNMEEMQQAYEVLVEWHGQEEADNILRSAVYEFFKLEFLLGLFDNSYLDMEYALANVWSEDAMAYGETTRDQSVVMLKNDGTVAPAEEGAEKKTIYVPAAYTPATQRSAASAAPTVNVEALSEYFNVVTDTIGEPSGKTEAGDPMLMPEDIIPATEEELADVDFFVVGMNAPYTGSAVVENEDGTSTWYPASLQYEAYTAEVARDVSLGGKELEDGSKENRSYNGNSVDKSANYKYLEILQNVDAMAGDKPVVVVMNAGRGMVWSEVEPMADVILMTFNSDRGGAVSRILAGVVEPSALLPMQQPANMETVETQLEDVPRDMEVYVDAAGNAYDFAFGMNWSGVIDDERVATYSAEPITEITSIEVKWPE